MKKLIIAEKPSVSRDIARILNISGQNDGYIENNEWVVTWCVGHLVTMSYPDKYGQEYKAWSLDTLPFLPQNYMYEVIDSVKEQYSTVKKLLNRGDISEIYVCTDSGREGEVIYRLVRNMAGINPSAIEKRVWIDSFTSQEVQKGFANAKPISYYDNLASAGIMRGIEDYAMGINFSRALTLKYRTFVNAVGGKPVISVGRVMTCVLGMIVDKEREIRSFKESFYYTTSILAEGNNGDFEAVWKLTDASAFVGSPLLYENKGFVTKEAATSAVNGDFGVVYDKIVKETKKSAPLLFNLAELQSKCSSIFHLSPSDTLGVAQSLYEKGLTTYPRTDARVLSTAILCENQEKLSKLSFLYPEIAGITSTNIEKPYVDDSKITDHYAIIPTGKTDLSSLNDLEKKVFDLICRRYISIFFTPAKFSNINIDINVGREIFSAGGKICIDPGYLVVSTDKPQTDEKMYNALIPLNKGDTVRIKDVIIKDCKTMPPKRYTSGSIILAMENAGKFIEDEELRAQIKSSGIGTSATRADILEKLCDIDYIKLEKKTQQLTPKPTGEVVYEVVKATIPSMLKAEMTASWEKGLAGIENGSVSFDYYKALMDDFVAKRIAEIKTNDYTDYISQVLIGNPFVPINQKPAEFGVVESSDTRLKCPVCGGRILKNRYGTKEWYACENYSKDTTKCFFSVGKICNNLIDTVQLNNLLTIGHTDTLDFVSGDGRPFKTALKLCLDISSRVCKVDFASFGTKSMFSCPKCGKTMLENDEKYFCDCGVYIKKVFGGRAITKDEVEKLLTNKTTGFLSGFYSEKKRKYFDAELILDSDFKMTLSFGNAAPKTNRKKRSETKRKKKSK